MVFQIPHLKTITINLLFHVRSFQNTPYLKGIPNVQPLDCNSPSHEALINKTLQLAEAENILHTVVAYPRNNSTFCFIQFNFIAQDKNLENSTDTLEVGTSSSHTFPIKEHHLLPRDEPSIADCQADMRKILI